MNTEVCRKINVAFAAAATGFAALAAVPDLTASLELIGNPATNRWPDNAYTRGVLDLQFHRGTLLAGGGETEVNRGPVWLYGIDPVTCAQTFEYSAGTEAIANFRIASWGDLYAPAQDPRESNANEGHVFTRDASGVWSRHKTIGGSVPYASGSSKGSVLASTHTWDMEEFGGRVFAAGYELSWSADRFATFTRSGSITNAYRLFYFMDSATSGRGQWSLRRQMKLLRFADDLYAVANALIQPNLSVADSNDYYNKVEVFHWNPETLKFDEGRQPMSTLFPDISSNDFRLVLSSTGDATWDALPTGTYDRLLVRLWSTTPFKDRVLYVGCYDTQPRTPALTSYPLPLMGCSAYVETRTINGVTTKTLKAARLSFDGDKEEYPWDFAVVGGTVYALTSKPNATTKVVRHSVWKSMDGTTFTRLFSFDFHQNMISLDYRDGWFFFGVGVKTATRGYAYDSQKDESGAIYRVRLPMEPTAVEVADAPVRVAEGSSAQISFRLSAQPASNLTLRVAARPRRGVSLDRSSLAFTASNWSVPQTVAVSLADDDVADSSPVIVQCGAFGNDVERGEFASTEVTSADVVLEAVENDLPPSVASESFAAGPTSCVYRVALDSFGSVNGVSAAEASVSVRVYADAAHTALAGETSGKVSATGTTFEFTVAGLERSTPYWLVAETAAAAGVARTYETGYRSPIAEESELSDLMDDESNREAAYSNATSSDGAARAFDNADGNFGGYNKPVYFIYKFKEARTVNAFGVKAMASGDTDQHPSTFVVYGSNVSTNKADFVKLAEFTGQTDCEYGEWRRWFFDNESPYVYYKIQFHSDLHQHAYIQEIELYGIGAGDESSGGGTDDPPSGGGTDDPGQGGTDDPPSGGGTDSPAPAVVEGEVRYVSTTGNDENDGLTTDTAKLTIAAALDSLADVAETDPCTICVAPGRYPVSSRMELSRRVRLVGCDSDPSRVVVSNTANVAWGNTKHRCVTLNHPDAIVSGITFENGKDYDDGGNVRIDANGGMVTNCVIRNGFTREGNTSAGANIAIVGPGKVTHCKIFGGWENNCSGCTKTSSVYLNASDARIENCLIDGFLGSNVASQSTKNSCGIYIEEGVAANCTVMNCTSPYTEAAGVAGILIPSDSGRAVNCVSVANVDSNGTVRAFMASQVSRAVNCAFDAIEGEAAIPDGMVNPVVGTASSFFKDYANGDYTPAAAGPLVNKGANYEGMASVDLAGRARLVGRKVDIGCYEAGSSAFVIRVR